MQPEALHRAEVGHHVGDDGMNPKKRGWSLRAVSGRTSRSPLDHLRRRPSVLGRVLGQLVFKALLELVLPGNFSRQALEPLHHELKRLLPEVEHLPARHSEVADHLGIRICLGCVEAASPQAARQRPGPVVAAQDRLETVGPRSRRRPALPNHPTRRPRSRRPGHPSRSGTARLSPASSEKTAMRDVALEPEAQRRYTGKQDGPGSRWLMPERQAQRLEIHSNTSTFFRTTAQEIARITTDISGQNSRSATPCRVQTRRHYPPR